MASFQTFFRTVVMLAVLGLLAKVWYHYGLTVDELKTIGSRAAEVAQQAWAEYWQSPGNESSLANDPRLPPTNAAPAPFVPSGTPLQPMPHPPNHAPAANPSAPGTVQMAGGVPAEVIPVDPPLPSLSPSTPWPTSAAPEPTRLPADPTPPTEDARLSAMLERLAQFGVRDQDLRPWGGRGEFVRFSCSLPWANSPAYSRHFEAVADTPLAAVEQVAAEIEAWRGGQR